MDSEHRHELKTNELAEWINNFPEFAKRNLYTIIGAALIIAAIFSYFFIDRTKGAKAGARQAKATAAIQKVEQDKMMAFGQSYSGETDIESGLLAAANNLETAARQARKPMPEALLLIKRGEALRADLHYSPQEVEEEVINSQIELARKAYQQALSKAKGNSTLTAMAKFGLGLCAEELGDFIKAKEIYSEITSDQDFRGTIFPTQAQFRLDIMDDHQKEFVFVPAPKVDVETPEGFDEKARDALEKGQIYIEKPETDTPPETPADTKTPEQTDIPAEETK